jgi:hypothetical protein
LPYREGRRKKEEGRRWKMEEGGRWKMEDGRWKKIVCPQNSLLTLHTIMRKTFKIAEV